MTSSHLRIPPTEITGVKGAIVKRFSTKMLGGVPESLGVLWHNQQVLNFGFGLGRKTKKWDACPQQLKAFAHMAVASHVGCSFCLDLGYFEARHKGLDLDKAREVPVWRTSSKFTELEREVMEYAEAMSNTPLTVTDELSASLLDQLGPAGLLELTSFIALANFYSRSNVAVGIEAEGLAASCQMKPLAVASAVA
jgi:alkylhydroperoxidase family enzyme